MWLLCVWVPSLRELMSSIMRWRSGLIASVIIGNSCLRSGSRDPDLQDRMTHTLLTISPRVEPYWRAPRPPPRAIAQRFSGVLDMFSSLEVKVLYPRVSDNARAIAARRGLKEAYSKRAGRWTNIGYKAQASDERATYREVHIHQGCEA